MLKYDTPSKAAPHPTQFPNFNRGDISYNTMNGFYEIFGNLANKKGDKY